MTLIVPNLGEIGIAQRTLNQALQLKLYSNDLIPEELSTIDSFTEVIGGGYTSFPLEYANWEISDNAVCIHTALNFSFTGITNAPTTVYGYYVVDPDNVVLWAERFPTTALPFIPIADSLIRITPRIQFT